VVYFKTSSNQINFYSKKQITKLKAAILTQVINQSPVHSLKYYCSSKIGFTFV